MSIPFKQMTDREVRLCLAAAEKNLNESEVIRFRLRMRRSDLEARRLFRESRLMTKPLVHATRQVRMARSHRDSLKVEAKRRGLK